MKGEYQSALFNRIQQDEDFQKQERRRVASRNLEALFARLTSLQDDFRLHHVRCCWGTDRRDIADRCIIMTQADVDDSGTNAIVHNGEAFIAVGNRRLKIVPGQPGDALNDKLSEAVCGDTITRPLGGSVREALELIVRSLVSTGGLPLPKCAIETRDYVVKQKEKASDDALLGWIVTFVILGVALFFIFVG